MIPAVALVLRGMFWLVVLMKDFLRKIAHARWVARVLRFERSEG